MIHDHALEQNRRVGWARYFAGKQELAAERLRTAELAVWLEELDCDLPGENSPLRQLVDDALAAVPGLDLELTRRYVRHQLGGWLLTGSTSTVEVA